MPYVPKKKVYLDKDAIEKRAKGLNWSLAKLARKVGRSDGWLSKNLHEHDALRNSAEVVSALAEVLLMAPDDIIEHEFTAEPHQGHDQVQI